MPENTTAQKSNEQVKRDWNQEPEIPFISQEALDRLTVNLRQLQLPLISVTELINSYNQQIQAAFESIATYTATRDITLKTIEVLESMSTAKTTTVRQDIKLDISPTILAEALRDSIGSVINIPETFKSVIEKLDTEIQAIRKAEELQDSMLASSATRQGLTDSISQEITIRDREEVENFLKQLSPGFVQLINGLVPQIRHYFEQEPLYLQIFSNQEGSNWDFLILSIATEKEVDEALKLIRDFQESSWVSGNTEFTGKLTVDLEFQ